MNVRFNYRYLVGLCLAAASFPALSAIRDSPIKLGDTTYYEVERGVKLKGGQLAEHNRNTMKLIPMEREIYQRQTSKIVVDAHKVSAPVDIESKWGAGKVQGALKNSVKTAFTRGNLAFLFGGLALDSVDYLLKNNDLQYKDDQLLKSDSSSKGGSDYPFGSTAGWHTFDGVSYFSHGSSDRERCNNLAKFFLGYTNANGSFTDYYKCQPYIGSNTVKTFTWPPNDFSTTCLSTHTLEGSTCKYSGSISATLSDIESLNLSDYKPKEQDLPFLSNYLGTPDQIKFSNISEFQGESKTFTYTDENGDTITKQVNTWHNFAVSPSTVTSSSGDPKLEVSTKTQTDTYKDGQKTSSKTETETTKPSDNEDKPTFVGGGGSGKETPTDCAFFPTLCKWLDWTQEDAGDEPDLDKIINDADDFEREYKITGGAASCPAPYKLTIPFFAKTFDVSYQPFCDFATYLRYLFLAFCYFTAARYFVRYI